MYFRGHFSILFAVLITIWKDFTLSEGAVWQCGGKEESTMHNLVKANNTHKVVKTEVGKRVHVSFCVQTDRFQIAPRFSFKHRYYTNGSYHLINNITQEMLFFNVSFGKTNNGNYSNKSPESKKNKNEKGSSNVEKLQRNNITLSKKMIAYLNLIILKVRRKDFQSDFWFKIFAKNKTKIKRNNYFLLRLTLKHKVKDNIIDPLEIGLPIGILLALICVACLVVIFRLRGTSRDDSILDGEKQECFNDQRVADAETATYANIRDVLALNKNIIPDNNVHTKSVDYDKTKQEDPTNQNAGRIISDEGLVYVTVVHTGKRDKKKTSLTNLAAKGNSPLEVVEYTTFDFNASAQLTDNT